jgi:hypothetical protein
MEVSGQLHAPAALPPFSPGKIPGYPFYCKMDTEEFPGMVTLHCNGRTYSSRQTTHTLASSILPLLEAPAEGFFWNLPEFGRRILFDDFHGYETCSLGAYFQIREQPEVTGSEVRRVRWLGDDRNCCTTSDVWLSALS